MEQHLILPGSTTMCCPGNPWKLFAVLKSDSNNRSKYTSLFCQTKRWASQTSQNSIKNKESKSFEIQIAMLI
jgi:hypothetical protein